jgi:hypothetical protein
MFRKTILALATTAALAAAALAPTSASAGPHFGHHGGGWWGPGIAAGIIGTAIVTNSCLRRETFRTPYGWRTRVVNVCY